MSSHSAERSKDVGLSTPTESGSVDGGRSVRSVARWVGRVLVVGGVIGITVGAFLPWVYSGAAARNSFGVVRAARALGIVESDALRTILALWYFVPFLAAVSVVLLSLGRTRSAGALSAILGAIAVVIGLMVGASSADLGSGPAVAAVAGALSAVGGVLIMATAGPGTSGWGRSGGST